MLVFTAAPAEGARPIKIGLGEAPGVAVDAAGTAHVAYNNDYIDDAGQPLMYCAWPKAARTCAPRAIISDGASPFAQPALVRTGPAPNEVAIVSARGSIEAVQSLDGGATFGAPAAFGQGRFFDGVFGPQGMVLSFDGEFRYSPFAGPADNSAIVDLGGGLGVNSVVGVDPGGRPVYVFGAALPGIKVRAWSGQGDIHDPLTWSAASRIAYSNDFALANGPRGLWLVYADFNRGGSNPVIARKFSGQRFGRAHRIPAGRLGRSSIIGLGYGQSPTGQMAAVWYNSPLDRLEYSASKTGARWTPARVLATGVELPSRIQVALGADGRGLVVWDENSGDDINAVKINIRSLLR
jgi:hypothetical protein